MSRSLYDDGRVTLDAEGVTLRGYYFPKWGRKQIPYRDIRQVNAVPLDWRTGRFRLWGTSHPGYWAPYDPDRRRKETVLVLDLGRRVKPVVTPDDPQQVLTLLRERLRGQAPRERRVRRGEAPSGGGHADATQS